MHGKSVPGRDQQVQKHEMGEDTFIHSTDKLSLCLVLYWVMGTQVTQTDVVSCLTVGEVGLQ